MKKRRANGAGPWFKLLAKSVILKLSTKAVRVQDSIWEVLNKEGIPPTPVANQIEATYIRPMWSSQFLLNRGYHMLYFECYPYNFNETAYENFIEDLYQRCCKTISGLEGANMLVPNTVFYDVTPDLITFVRPRSEKKGYDDALGGSGHSFKTDLFFVL